MRAFLGLLLFLFTMFSKSTALVMLSAIKHRPFGVVKGVVPNVQRSISVSRQQSTSSAPSLSASAIIDGNNISLAATAVPLSVPSRFLTVPSEHGKFERDRFSVAPMMEYTDRHQRSLFRLLSRESVLYTEMVTAAALVHCDQGERLERLLQADFALEGPLVLQIGGSDRAQCRSAVRIAKDYGYREINLNVGCPSDRVADAGCFGAALMAKPHLVAEILQDMNDEMFSRQETNVSSPVRPCTVKCRIGIDDQESYEHVCEFVRIVSERGGVSHFVVHARKAILGGRLSPEQNRKIPPLKYDYVYRLVQDFPHLQFTINGGVCSYEEIKKHIEEGKVHGVMVGRQCVNLPYYWRNIDSLLYHQTDPGLTRREILDKYSRYAEQQEQQWGRKVRRKLIKPLFNLFSGELNGKQFRVRLDSNLQVFETTGTMRDVIMTSSSALSDSVLDAREPVRQL